MKKVISGVVGKRTDQEHYFITCNYPYSMSIPKSFGELVWGQVVEITIQTTKPEKIIKGRCSSCDYHYKNHYCTLWDKEKSELDSCGEWKEYVETETIGPEQELI